MALFGLGLLKDDIEVWMTDQLRSALLIDNKGCVVPVHATFGEFLLDPKRCINPLYHISKPVQRIYAARNWDLYLEKAEFGDELKQQLMCLIHAQMPVYMRIGLNWTSTAERLTARMEQWLNGSEDAAEIFLEYAKSSAYSWLWWRTMYKSPNLRTDAGVASPNINADDIASRMMEIFDKLHDSSVLDLTVRSSEIARYQALHEELV
ncbi:hypothetical protein K438DRAFT_1926095 [Mycena galopus ATCC 62051]|nr:hypothetical protein K438DRAFT_1926095 [Mycena galopus ATCC 62051]